MHQTLNVLSFTQNAIARKVKALSASNTLALEHQVTGERYLADVVSELELTQELLGQCIRTKTATSALQLAQSVQLSKTQNLSPSNTLVFKHNYQKPTGFGLVTVNEVEVVKVDAIVVLQSGDHVIVLPKPEFGDTLGGSSLLNVKRAMDGTTRLYKRSQISNKLTYTFVMDRNKALELKNFVALHPSDQIKMTNWKGEVWIVKFVNNPFTFTEDARRDSTGGNRTNVTLDFEGVKIN